MELTFTGDEERTYLDVNGRSLHAIPGETYDLLEAPDERFVPATPSAVAQPEIDASQETGEPNVG